MRKREEGRGYPQTTNEEGGIRRNKEEKVHSIDHLSEWRKEGISQSQWQTEMQKAKSNNTYTATQSTPSLHPTPRLRKSKVLYSAPTREQTKQSSQTANESTAPTPQPMIVLLVEGRAYLAEPTTLPYPTLSLRCSLLGL